MYLKVYGSDICKRKVNLTSNCRILLESPLTWLSGRFIHVILALGRAKWHAGRNISAGKILKISLDNNKTKRHINVSFGENLHQASQITCREQKHTNQKARTWTNLATIKETSGWKRKCLHFLTPPHTTKNSLKKFKWKICTGNDHRITPAWQGLFCCTLKRVKRKTWQAAIKQHRGNEGLKRELQRHGHALTMSSLMHKTYQISPCQMLTLLYR